MSSPPTAHPSPAVLASLALGQLDDASLSALEAHVAGCGDCAQVLASTPGDSFTALLQVAQSFSDTALPTPAPGTVTTPMPAGKGELTAIWTSGDMEVPIELPTLLADHPRYRPIRLLGHGGMGEVWLAEHKLMGRQVAVKVIRPEILARPGAAERFRREFQSAARLHHPNIVTAFDADEAGDTPLLAMEYVEGISLADEVHQRGALPIAEACEYIRQTALGLQHAHEKGLVHRDLKPQNLMISNCGLRIADCGLKDKEAADSAAALNPQSAIRNPQWKQSAIVKILDFGLAVLHDAGAGQGGLTGANMVVGTPDYIAPEQAEESRKADFKSDIYSLGCTLYQLLTGSVPFPEESILRKLDAHRRQEPKPIRTLRPEVPVGLTQVVAKMMAKRPADRHASAAAVAAALEPFTRYVPPAPRRRRPFLAAALALLFAGIITAAGVTYYIVTDNGTIEVRTDDMDIKLIAERNGKLITLEDLKNKQTWVVDTGDWTVRLDGNPQRLKLELPHTFTLKRGGKQVVTIRRVKAPEPPIVQAPPVQEKLGEVRRFVGHAATVSAVALAPDGKLVLTGAGMRDDERGLDAQLWDANTGKELRRFKGHTSAISCAAFSPDGTQAVTSSYWPDATVRIWDVATGKELKRMTHNVGVPVGVYCVTFAADGKHVFTGSDDKTLRMWSVATGKEVKRFDGHPAVVRCVAVSRDGKHLASGGSEKNASIRLWDLATGKELKQFVGHTEQVDSVAFSPDGSQIVSGGADATVRLWDVATAKEIRRLVGHTERVDGSTFTPDGRCILTGSADRTVRLWDVATGKELHRFEGHTSAVLNVAVAANGRFALSCSNDNTARLWRLPELLLEKASAAEVRRILAKGMAVWSTDISPDGRYCVAATGDVNLHGMKVQLFDLHTGALVRDLSNEQGDYVVRFANDGKWIVHANYGGRVKVTETATGKEVRDFQTDTPLWNALVLGGGKYALVASDKAIQIRDLDTGKEVKRWQPEPGKFLWAAANDGKHFLYAADGKLPYRVLNLETGKEERVLATAVDKKSVYFLPGGRHGVWEESTYAVFDTATGKELKRLDLARYLKDSVDHALPDNALFLAVAYKDRSMAVWEIATGKELCRYQVDGDVTRFALGADGRHAVAGTSVGTLYFWRLPAVAPLVPDPVDESKGAELRRILPEPDRRVWTVDISPDNRHCVTAVADLQLHNMKVQLLDLRTGAVLRALSNRSGDYMVRFANDGKWIVRANFDGTVHISETATGKEVRRFQTDTPLWFLVVLPGGKRAFIPAEKSVQIYDLATGQLVKRWETDPNKFLRAPSVDGKHLLYAVDGKLPYRVLNLDTGKEDSGFDTALNKKWVELLPGGRHAVWEGTSLNVFDTETGKELKRIAVKECVTRAAPSDQRFVFQAFKDGSVVLWETARGKELCRFQMAAGDSIRELALSADGRHAVAGTETGTLYFWRLPEVAPPAQILRVPPTSIVWTADISTDNRYALAASGPQDPLNRVAVRLYHLGTGVTLREWKGGYVALFANGGKWIVNGHIDGTITVLETATGKELKRFQCAAPLWIAYVPLQGERVISNSPTSQQLWDLATGKQLKRWEGNGRVFSALPTSDGKHLLVSLDRDKLPYRAFNLQTLKEEPGNEKLPNAEGLHLLAEGQPAAWRDETLVLYDRATGKEVKRIDTAQQSKGALHRKFLSDLRRLLVVNKDGSIVLWDVSTEAVLCRLTVAEGPAHYYFLTSSDERHLLAATGNGSGALYIWRLPEARPK